MHIEYNFNFTPSAAAAAKAHGLSSFSFSHQAGAPDPLVGDLFSAEETMPLVFVITRRHLHYVRPDYLQVALMLDCQAA